MDYGYFWIQEQGPKPTRLNGTSIQRQKAFCAIRVRYPRRGSGAPRQENLSAELPLRPENIEQLTNGDSILSEYARFERIHTERDRFR